MSRLSRASVSVMHRPNEMPISVIYPIRVAEGLGVSNGRYACVMEIFTPGARAPEKVAIAAGNGIHVRIHSCHCAT